MRTACQTIRMLPADHFPNACKAIWQFEGIWASSRHIPGGLLHQLSPAAASSACRTPAADMPHSSPPMCRPSQPVMILNSAAPPCHAMLCGLSPPACCLCLLHSTLRLEVWLTRVAAAGVRFAGMIHPGLIGTAPSHELLAIWNKRERALVEEGEKARTLCAHLATRPLGESRTSAWPACLTCMTHSESWTGQVHPAVPPPCHSPAVNTG